MGRGKGCGGARGNSGGFSSSYCLGTDNNMNPDHSDYNPERGIGRDYFEACCEWTGKECVDKIPIKYLGNGNCPSVYSTTSKTTLKSVGIHVKIFLVADFLRGRSQHTQILQTAHVSLIICIV